MSCLSLCCEIFHLFLDTPSGQGRLEAGEFSDLLLHDVIESVVEARHTDHDSWLKLRKVILQLHHISLEESVLHLVSHCAHEKAALEDVSKWKIRNIDVIIADLKLSIKSVHTANIGHEVAVSQHHTLWHASRA